MTKIAMISKLYPPPMGGMERHIQQLAGALGQVAPRLEVQVIAGQEKISRFKRELKWELNQQILIQRAATIGRVASTPLVLGFSRLLRKAAADVYHYHGPYPWAELATLRSSLRAACVVTWHHDVIRQEHFLRLYRPLLDLFFKRMDCIIVWSPQLRDNSPFLQKHQDKVVVIPGGIETRQFVPTPASQQQAAALRQKLAPQGPVTLFVGRFVYYKGLDFLIKAMPDVPGTLVLVGRGPLQAELEELAAQMGVRDRVHFINSVTDEELPLYYQASDVFVLPSSHSTEAFGLVQLEAHASGVPSISTELGTGTSFVNVHEETGLVVPAQDSPALAAALRRLLENDAWRTQLGEQAQRRAVKEFDINVCGEKVAQLYKQLLEMRVLTHKRPQRRRILNRFSRLKTQAP